MYHVTSNFLQIVCWVAQFLLRSNTQLKSSFQPQRQPSRTSTDVEILNNSSEIINWPQNRIKLHNYNQQQPQLHHFSINPNTSTEQFDVIDENERQGRTFTFITDFINSLTQPTCVYPCTLTAYQLGQCCDVVAPQPQPNVCCQQQPMPLPSPPIRPLPPIYPPPPPLRPPLVGIPPIPTFPLLPTQCCNTCPSYGYYGPQPCIRYSIPQIGTGRFTLYIPSILG